MATKILQKLYNVFKGLHTTSSAVTRGDEFASEMKNVTLSYEGALKKRPGSQLLYNGGTNPNQGGFGAFTYYTTDSNGNNVENVVVNDAGLWKAETAGYTELKTATPSVPALVATIAKPFDNIYTQSADLANFEHPSYYAVLNNLYMNTGYNDQFKWDGISLYKSGLPFPTDANIGATPGGAAITVTTKGDVIWRTQFFQMDANRNLIEGDLSTSNPISAAQVAAGAYASVTMTFGVPDFTKGYQMNYARVSGMQTGSTFICDGQFADGTNPAGGADDYYPSLVTGQIVVVRPRIIATGVFEDPTYAMMYLVGTVARLGVDTSTVQLLQLDGSTVNIRLNDGDYISTMGMRVYRNENGGTTWFLLEEVAVAPVANALTGEITSNNFSYTDSLADTSVPGLEAFLEFDESREPAPPCKYSCLWRDTPILAGDPLNPNTIYYASYQGVEYFPSSLSPNSALIGGADTGRITGIAELGSNLIVFKEKAIYRITGELAQDNFRVDQIPNSDMGCIAFHTIKKLGNALAFLSKKGVWAVSEDGSLSEISSNIRETFVQYINNTTSNVYRFKRAVAVNWSERDKYMLYIPIVASNGGVTTVPTIYDNGNDSATGSNVYPSTVFVFDYFRGFISKWTRLNWLGGVTLKNDKPYFVSTVRDAGTLHTYSNNMRDDRIASPNPYVDSLYNNTEEAIPFIYVSTWHNGGEPSVFKKFLRLKLLSSAEYNSTHHFTMTVTAYLDLEGNIPKTITSMEMGKPGTTSPGGYPIDYQERTIKFRVNKGRFIKLKFSNMESVGVNIDGYELEVAAPFMPAIKE